MPSLNSHAAVEHTTEEWETQRERFTRLYAAENGNKTLREVKTIMEREYGFKATERQYKRRIVKWNLCKNVKAVEKEAILKEQLRRNSSSNQRSDSTTRPLEFRLNGRPVERRKIQRYMRKQGLGNKPLSNVVFETIPEDDVIQGESETHDSTILTSSSHDSTSAQHYTNDEDENIAICSICGYKNYPNDFFNTMVMAELKTTDHNPKSIPPTTDPKEWVQTFVPCKQCQMLQHAGCAGVLGKFAPPDEYTCDECCGGRKKSICKGEVEDGVAWGCGRSFASVFALDRHHATPAGKMCTKPLFYGCHKERKTD